MSSPSASRSTIGRLDSLTSLRWWAAFGVFLFHMRNIVTFPSWLHWLVADGYLGVTFFFVLSGFVLTWSWKRETPIRAFYWRRFARIYPLHLLALAIAIPVFYRLTVSPEQWWIKPLDWGILLLSVLVIQGWWLAPNILFSGNPAAWTLTVEAFFYALHPLFVRGVARLSQRGALIAGGVVFALAVTLRGGAIFAPDLLGHIPEPIMHLPSFVLGMLLAWAYRQGWRLRMPVLIPAGALITWLLISALAAREPGRIALVASFTPEIVAILCALIIAAAATADLEGKRGINTWRPFVALGEWSFAFYLIHATLIYIAMEVFGPQYDSSPRTILWCALLLTASILAAWLMHRFVERPLERKLRSWQDRRIARSRERQPSGTR